MENTHMVFKTNIIKDKLLLHDAVEAEKRACLGEYANYIKYHTDHATWYQNIESFLDDIIVGHDATVDDYIECIYNKTFTLDEIEDLVNLKNNPLFKKAVGTAALNNIAELEDYFADYFSEDEYLDINNKGQTFTYNGKKVRAVKTVEELGLEVASIAEKITLLKKNEIITEEKAQEFHKLLFDIYEYYLSIANGEQLEFPKISDTEYDRLEKDAFYKKLSVERQLMNVIRNNKSQFKDVQKMQQEYYEKNKSKIK